MRKLAAFVFLLAFVFFMAIGLTVVSTPVPDQTQPTMPTQFPNSNLQTNYLIIHTTSLSEEQPRLVSVWGLLFFNPLETNPAQSPVIHFQQIYPSLAVNSSINQLAGAYSVSTQKEVSDEFLLKANDIANFQGYILLDDYAIQVLIQRVMGKAISLATAPASDLESTRALLQTERALLVEFCGHINLAEENRGPRPNWRELSRQHFHTNLSFDEFMAFWEIISSPTRTISCEVSPIK